MHKIIKRKHLLLYALISTNTLYLPFYDQSCASVERVRTKHKACQCFRYKEIHDPHVIFCLNPVRAFRKNLTPFYSTLKKKNMNPVLKTDPKFFT